MQNFLCIPANIAMCTLSSLLDSLKNHTDSGRGSDSFPFHVLEERVEVRAYLLHDVRTTINAEVGGRVPWW